MYKLDEQNTYFQLAKGTELQLGSETIVLAERTDVFIRKPLSRDSVAETLAGAKAGVASVALLSHKLGDFIVSYGANGRRILTEVEPEPAKEPAKTKTKAK